MIVNTQTSLVKLRKHIRGKSHIKNAKSLQLTHLLIEKKTITLSIGAQHLDTAHHLDIDYHTLLISQEAEGTRDQEKGNIHIPQTEALSIVGQANADENIAVMSLL